MPQSATDLAHQLITQTGQHLFLTGKAGTGKTTFLRKLKASANKNMVVAAPTGVAAINAGGVTLHSLFQLPFTPFIPDSSNIEAIKLNKAKREVLKNLHLLVIDEISMVRADTLDAIDYRLRKIRHDNTPFGGVQLLMIGDLYQLSPVPPNSGDDRALLKQSYPSNYFYHSHALAQTTWHYLELTKVYRQSDKVFIDILNKIRSNNVDSKLLEQINARYIPDFTPPDKQFFIRLTTHNKSAENINHPQMAQLKTPEHYFTAKVAGDYPEKNYPVEYKLCLKVGAQVMFTRNDVSDSQAFFNGKTGIITHITDKTVIVKCPQDTRPISVEAVTWENIEYEVDDKTNEIKENIKGSFTQIPLRLAWAITIHKSQGLTFDKLIVDAEKSFSHGQVYVALSRCTCLSGLVLQNPLPRQAIMVNSEVADFLAKRTDLDEQAVQAAQQDYEKKLLLELFTFQKINTELTTLTNLLRGNTHLVIGVNADALTAYEYYTDNIVRYQDKFCAEINSWYTAVVDKTFINTRVSKAAYYYQQHLAVVADQVSELQPQTDNQILENKLTNAKRELVDNLQLKLKLLDQASIEFSVKNYMATVLRFANRSKAKLKARKTSAARLAVVDVAHPELFKQLVTWRTEQAAIEQLANFRILHQQVLLHIVKSLPVTKEYLLQLPKVGDKTVEKYGADIIKIVANYCKDNNLATNLPIVAAKPSKVIDKIKNSKNTKEQTLDWYQQGKTPEQIAKLRNLALGTIYSHLVHFIKEKQVVVTELVSAAKIKTITAAIAAQGVDTTQTIKVQPIKEYLDNDFSYAEISLVIASL